MFTGPIVCIISEKPGFLLCVCAGVIIHVAWIVSCPNSYQKERKKLSTGQEVAHRKLNWPVALAVAMHTTVECLCVVTAGFLTNDNYSGMFLMTALFICSHLSEKLETVTKYYMKSVHVFHAVNTHFNLSLIHI